MTRCPLCPGIHNCVPPDGPDSCQYLFIGEAPGAVETKKLKPFCGKTGDEVNRHYLPLAGLRRPDVRIDNAIKCLPDRTNGRLDLKKQADRDLLMSCAGCHLYPEIARMRPKLLIPMGTFACHAIDPSINLELQHGMPVQTVWGMAFPMYHPAGGIHEPKKMLQIRTDWTRLKKYIAGKLYIPEDDYDGRETYEHLDDPIWIGAHLNQLRDRPLACDTESTRYREPYCITFSAEASTGFLLKADDQPCLAAFQHQLDAWRGPILWHNWLWDAQITAAMGLRFNLNKIVDTMALAFHLGNVPQGLKALAYRLLGMQMQDFDDLVIPYSREIVLDYYRQANLIEWGKPEQELERDKDGNWKLYKPQGFNAKLKRFFNDWAKDPDRDVSETWENNWEMHHEQVETELGPWPGKCISHAPFDEVVRYACRDADSLLRLYPVLKAAERMVRRKPQEHWYEG